MTADQHQVIAKLSTSGDLVRVSYNRPWHIAQAYWNQLDNARRAGLLPGVEYLMVRSTDDPQYRGLRSARRGEVTMLVGNSEVGPTGARIRNGYTALESAARAYARFSGRYRGLGGGWIYNVSNYDPNRPGSKPRPVIQGWWQFGAMLRNQGRLVELAGRFYVVAPLVGSDETAEAVA